MIKLYVDDVRIPPDKDWKLARTITEAVRILATTPVSEVSLDHDICYVNTDSGRVPEETFEAVAWYIALMPKEHRPVVKIHSGNPLADKKLKAILNQGE